MNNSEALKNGSFYELMIANEHQWGFNQHLYIFVRYSDEQKILIVANFNRAESEIKVKLGDDLLQLFNLSGHVLFTDLLTGLKHETDNVADGLQLKLAASSGMLLEF